MRRGKNSKCAVVAQSVERFLGKEEVRQFKSAQQLQQAKETSVWKSLFAWPRFSCETCLLRDRRGEYPADLISLGET